MAVISGLSTCSAEDSLTNYLGEVLPAGTEIEINESCGGTFGLNPAVALFQVAIPNQLSSPDLTAIAFEGGSWTRQASLQEFANQHGAPVGIGATILDGKGCLRDLRDDADSLLFEPLPGLYFRSNDQSVIIILPDGEPGRGVLFTQGR